MNPSARVGEHLYAELFSVGLVGVDGRVVSVEVDVSQGLPHFEIVGLPGGAVREARDRVRSAVRNAGEEWPNRRITVNLAPANLRKEGSGYDLAIAIGILAAQGSIEQDALRGTAFLGELALSGEVRLIHGVLPMVAAARDEGVMRAVVPSANSGEALLVEGVDVVACATLAQVLSFARSGERPPLVAGRSSPPVSNPVDMGDVKGQPMAKRALEIAAAGGHNVLLIGPPGSGKTMLAERFPSILPPLNPEEALAVARVHSVAGLLASQETLCDRRPFRAPHHTITVAGMVGGGRPLKPGVASEAHYGVLFLDELGEFSRAALEALRQPMQNGRLTLRRANEAVTFPAEFQLLGATNPCPCGQYRPGPNACVCGDTVRVRYRRRLSSPLLDRVDLGVYVDVPSFEDVAGSRGGPFEEGSGLIRERVLQAVTIQSRRYAGSHISRNAQAAPRSWAQAYRLDEVCEQALRHAYERCRLSARAYDRILRVSRTIADLAGSEQIRYGDIAEALNLRVPIGSS